MATKSGHDSKNEIYETHKRIGSLDHKKSKGKFLLVLN
jgi:hypothetical protein